ncbi:unnamed protein product [Linum trigynum]|uniref:Secreted protein n=1 Tax=Linum trigynum TaxID=586398 RepID=A0AAV2EZ52_9ROSI
MWVLLGWSSVCGSESSPVVAMEIGSAVAFEPLQNPISLPGPSAFSAWSILVHILLHRHVIFNPRFTVMDVFEQSPGGGTWLCFAQQSWISI